MTYQAIISQIEQVEKHPNADRLQIATTMGRKVIVGLNVKVGDIGVYFDTDGQLSEQFATANNLIRIKNPDGTYSGGFFNEKRKVRAQKFRGVESDGFWTELTSLNNLFPNKAEDIAKLGVGFAFDTLFETPICNKYYTPATLAKMAKNKKGTGPAFATMTAKGFAQHFDTSHLFRCVNAIPQNSLVYITEKLHGTSFRFGYVSVQRNKYPTLNPFMKLLCKMRLYNPIETKYEYLNGTRRTILERRKNPYYDNEDFRDRAVEPLIGKLHEGEVIYGELVGYLTNGKPIMEPQGIEDKELKKKYGDKMNYSYGCLDNECKMFVYRITRTDPDGNYVEYSWPQVLQRCQELEINPVPGPIAGDNSSYLFIYDGYGNDGFELCEITGQLGTGPSVLDQSHIKEGVVLRIEPPIGKPYFLKHKSTTFGILEGYLKEKEDYVDTEEVESGGIEYVPEVNNENPN